ncbi:MAG: oxygenase MpaB family protein [Mycobacterium sp.]
MKRPATRVADLLNPAATLLPAANVIMQLSLPGVGYGVLESPVDSGNVYKHPFKRARTTGTYLAVAAIGTQQDRELIRAAVDTAHRQVRSTSSSPVSYNAFDPRLQLWVAACLYRYFVDQHEFLHGPLADATADAVYRDAKRLGTTLQVREDKWPPDRVAFGEYWKRSLEDLQIDPPVREHLLGVASVAFLPWPLRALVGSFNLFATTGFLAPEFRALMRLDWSASQQRRFEWLLAALRLADPAIPHRVWIFGYRVYLWDMRFRARRGWRIV